MEDTPTDNKVYEAAITIRSLEGYNSDVELSITYSPSMVDTFEGLGPEKMPAAYILAMQILNDKILPMVAFNEDMTAELIKEAEDSTQH